MAGASCSNKTNSADTWERVFEYAASAFVKVKLSAHLSDSFQLGLDGVLVLL